MATLRVYRGDQLVAPFELGEGRTRIGRGTDNHLVLEDHDKQVSRSHAEIWHERGRYVIADLNSQNGVWIGERQIKTEEPLPVNVPVTIGPYRLILMPDEKSAIASTDELDAADVTGRGEAYIEETQLVEPGGTVPPASQRSQAPKPAAPRSPAAQPGHTQTGTSVVPAAKSRRNTIPIIAAVAGLLVLAVVVGVSLSRRDNTATPSPETPRAEGPSAPPLPAPPAKTPEEQFVEHFSLAQSHLEAGNIAAAKDENAAALGAIPNDERGLAQQRAIEAILNPPPPDPTMAVNKRTLDPLPKDPEKERRDQARAQFEQGKRAFEQGNFAEAIVSLEAAARSGVDFGATPSEINDFLAKAKSGRAQEQARERQATAQKALDEARAEVATDALTAFQKLREARAAYAELPGIQEAQATLEAEARRQGEAVLALAKNRENASRTEDAIKLYERASALLELLPKPHDGVSFAKQRIGVLRGGK